MLTFIVVRYQVLGIHRWSSAPDHRAYLRNDHAHIFQFEATAPVDHDDRAIEFHDLRDELISTIKSAGITDLTGNAPLGFGLMSCERIGRTILVMMPQLSSIRVSEDGQFDAIVYQEE